MEDHDEELSSFLALQGWNAFKVNNDMTVSTPEGYVPTSIVKYKDRFFTDNRLYPFRLYI